MSSWIIHLKWSLTGQTTLKVWVCRETFQSPCLRHEPKFSNKNTGLSVRWQTWCPYLVKTVHKVHVPANTWWPSLDLHSEVPELHGFLCCGSCSGWGPTERSAAVQTLLHAPHRTQCPQAASTPHYPLPTKILTQQTAGCSSCTKL